MPSKKLYLAIIPVPDRGKVIELRRQLNHRFLHGNLDGRDYAIAVHVDQAMLDLLFTGQEDVRKRSLVFRLK